MKHISIVLFLSLFLTSCSDNLRLEEDSYLIFGTFNFFCQTDCSEFYKIENEQLFADNGDKFVNSATLEFDENPLKDTKYLVGKVALDMFPDSLLDSTETSFGCPGCVDQGSILVVYHDGTKTNEWQIDPFIEALPGFLKDYVSELKNALEILSK